MVDMTAVGSIPVTGWRLWVPHPIQFVDSCDPRPHAHSVAFRLFGMRDTQPWPMYKPLRARCLTDTAPHDRVPQECCTCGIYAFRTLPQLVTELDGSPRCLLGEVRLWGKVIITERGYKAEYAYPTRLISMHPLDSMNHACLDAELEWAYGIKVERKSWAEVLREAGLW